MPARDDVLAGLASPRKRLPARLLYEAEGFELAGRIRELASYYPARAERELVEAHGAAIAAQLGTNARVVEPWRGDVERSARLLRMLDRPARYVPVDPDPDRAAHTAAAIRARVPLVDVEPATSLAQLAEEPRGDWDRTLAYLPGTAIGCIEPSDAVGLLRLLAEVAEPGGMLLLGADATSDPGALARGYGDAGGVLADWARHALVQVNRSYGADFDPPAFGYRAEWNPVVIRLELQLVSTRRQTVHVAGEAFELEVDETIDVEQRYQHTAEAMQAMLGMGGWWARQAFTASAEPMRLWACERRLRVEGHRRRPRRWWQG